MLEVAEDAREEQKQVDLIIKKTIQQKLAKIQKEYRFKKWKDQHLLLFVDLMDREKQPSNGKFLNTNGWIPPLTLTRMRLRITFSGTGIHQKQLSTLRTTQKSNGIDY